MEISVYIVDAFTDRVFGGNPAAVCPLKDWIDDATMQSIAAENNLSETAFFVKENGTYHLRWFTPQVEVNLCGHATLASAHVLFNHLNYRDAEIQFNSKSGRLIVGKQDNLLWLDFPANPPGAADLSEQLADGLNLAPREVLQTPDMFMAVFDKESDILAIAPDFNRLAELEKTGVIVTAGGESCDFVSRFFGPRFGINEDPVTGAAHCVLIPYWAKKLDKSTLSAMQMSKRRGALHCRYRGDRVDIGGQAVTYSVGKIIL